LKGQELDQILENFYPMFSEEKKKKAELLAHKIKVTRQSNGRVFHSHEFSPAIWSFNFEHFKNNILAVSIPN
jgi:predicted translin family RNA/ssDNA-binding protein